MKLMILNIAFILTGVFALLAAIFYLYYGIKRRLGKK